MKQLFLLCVIFCTISLQAQNTLPIPTIHFTFDVDGAEDTYITGINNHQHICGYYTEEGQSGVKGFMFNRDTLITLQYPGALNTYLGGIDSTGVIYGHFDMGNPSDAFPFRANPSGDNYTYTSTIGDFGNVTFLQVTSVGNNQNYAGQYATAPLRKFYFRDEIDGTSNDQNYMLNPDAAPTYGGGINDDNWVAGWYIDGILHTSFVWKTSDDYYAFNYPGENRTKFTGMNNNGIVVGNAGFGSQIGFFVEFYGFGFGTAQSLYIENAVAVNPREINDNNEIVGHYTDDNGRIRGFLMLAESELDFTPSVDGWAHENYDPPFWTPADYQNIDYNNDPFLQQLGIVADFPTTSEGEPFPSSSHPSWIDFVETFSPSTFYHYVNGQPVLVPYKFDLWEGFRADEFVGNCHGMSVTALSYLYQKQLLEMQYDVFQGMTQNLSQYTEMTSAQQRAITQTQVSQIGNPARHNEVLYLYDYSRGTISRLLKNMYDRRYNDPFTLNLRYVIQGTSNTGGHTVAPHRIQMVDNYDYVIVVYDSNAPSFDFATVILEFNGSPTGQPIWTYGAINENFEISTIWNGTTHVGISVQGPVSRLIETPYLLSGEAPKEQPGAARDEEDVDFLSFIVSGPAEFIALSSEFSDTLGVWEDITHIGAPFGKLDFLTHNSTPKLRSLTLHEGQYEIESKEFTDGPMTFMLTNDQTGVTHFFERNVTSDDLEYFTIEDGFNYENLTPNTKEVSAGMVVRTENGETIIYKLNGLSVEQNENLKVSIINDFMLKVDNGDGDNDYVLDISYWTAEDLHEFSYSSIDFDANATHIISPFPPGEGEFNPSVIVDLGQNGFNDDTLFVNNQLLPILAANATGVLAMNAGQDRDFLVYNAGGGTLNWTATTDVDWITFNISSGSNAGLVEFSVAANPSEETRSGVITLSGEDQSLEVNVTQGEFDVIDAVSVTKDSQLMLFPNPANDQFTIYSSHKAVPSVIELYDLNGRRIEVPISRTASGAISVKVNQLPNGIYIVNMLSNGDWHSSKIMIRH